MKPRIAIPQPVSGNPDFCARAVPHYHTAVERAGGEPVSISLDLDNHQIARLTTTCDAVLLPGSPADINPERYGVPREPHTAPSDAARDNVDEILLHDAYNMHKPIFGVCFGLQALNVWRSGTLIQHLDTAVRHTHQKNEPDARHRITLVPASRLARILGTADLTVNSSHHQAAGVVGDGLMAVAVSPEDKVIEALEGVAPDHWVVAVQWHPERLPDDPAAQALFRAFIEAARQRGMHPRTTTLDFESLLRK